MNDWFAKYRVHIKPRRKYGIRAPSHQALWALGRLFQPSGDIGRDMAAIKAYYAPLPGQDAQQFDAD